MPPSSDPASQSSTLWMRGSRANSGCSGPSSRSRILSPISWTSLSAGGGLSHIGASSATASGIGERLAAFRSPRRRLSPAPARLSGSTKRSVTRPSGSMAWGWSGAISTTGPSNSAVLGPDVRDAARSQGELEGVMRMHPVGPLHLLRRDVEAPQAGALPQDDPVVARDLLCHSPVPNRTRRASPRGSSD